MVSLIAENQVTRGGPVLLLQIENEYYNGAGHDQYFHDLQQRARDMGVVSDRVLRW